MHFAFSSLQDNVEGTHHNTVHASAEIVGSWTGVLYGMFFDF